MKILIVGGHFGTHPKESRIIKTIVKDFRISDDVTVINGGTIAKLLATSAAGYKLILWFPDLDNIHTKIYPVKDTGAVLICSKVSRGTNARIEAVSRIFKMHANAVVLISEFEKRYYFELIDALDNTWGYRNDDINMLTAAINNLAIWTFESKRQSLHKDQSLQQLVELNRQVADQFETDMGRYFGNCSTRCMSMFPSTRYYFSRRNVDKNRLAVKDMAATTDVNYYGETKPRVDTPVQAALYRQCSKINYFIHGHAHIPNQPETLEYYPCGDLREVPGIVALIGSNTHGIINLKNHGFLIYASNLIQLKALVTLVKFVKEPHK